MTKYLLLLILVFQSLTTIAQDSTRVFVEDDLYGLKGTGGEILVQPNYDKLGWSNGSEQLINGSIGYQQDLWGLISSKGKRLTNPVYYGLEPLTDELILAGIRGKFSNRIFYGILNAKGKVLLSSTYTSIQKQDDAFIVSKNESDVRNYGLLNKNLKFILPLEYRSIERFSEGVFIYQNTASKYGLLTASGKVLLEPSIDKIEYVSGVSIIHVGGALGVISEQGELLAEAKYKDIKFSNSGRIDVRPFPEWSVVTEGNDVLFTVSCDSLRVSDHYYFTFSNRHLKIQDKSLNLLREGEDLKIKQVVEDKLILDNHGKWGVLKGESEFLPFEYDSLYSDGGYYYGQKSDGWSVINKFGRTITTRNYEEIQRESEGLIAVKNNGYWGFIDFQGDEVIPRKFDTVEPFRHRVAKVEFLDSYGTVNHFGEWVCEPVYDVLDITDFGLTVAMINSRTDVLNGDGNVTFQTFNHLKHHEVGFLEETEEGDKGLISNYGVLLLSPFYDSISTLIQDSLLVVGDGQDIGAIDLTGRWVIPMSTVHQSIGGMREERISIKKDGLFGFLDMQGLLRIANRYDSVKLFNEGMAAIQLRNSWGFIDARERLKIQPTYDDVGSFKDGEAKVLEDGRWGTISKDGSVLIPITFEEIKRLEHGYFAVTSQGKYGLYGPNGRRITSPKFNYLQVTDKGYFIVDLRGKYGVLNNSGLFSIPQIYDRIVRVMPSLYLCVKNEDSDFSGLEN